jgi:hypothetical protein
MPFAPDREPEFTEADLETALRYMRQYRSKKGVDPEWEEAKQFALAEKGLSAPTRYRHHPVEGAPTAVAGRVGLAPDGSEAIFPVTGRGRGYTVHGDHISRTKNDSDSTSGGPAHAEDYPAPVGLNVLQRLGIQAIPSEPWYRPVLEINGMARSFTAAEVRAASEYAELYSLELAEACRILGFKGRPLAEPKGTP